MKQRNPALFGGRNLPWCWIPSVYIAEGLPYFAVNTLTVLMYTKLGVSIEQMALYTGWLYLPWVIKPFWSPFVDLIRTKRWWTLTMQFLLCITMALTAMFILTPGYFTLTLIVFWFMAFFSATHDIAADGYYMMALNEKEQAGYVGLRSTFYRVASVLGQGGLVIIAGYLEISLGSIPQAWSITFAILSAFFFLLFLWDVFVMPRSENDRPIAGVTASSIVKDFGKTFVTFFEKKYVWIALAFMLLYRLPEALCLKLVQPFLVEPVSNGGLGLTTAQVGIANGTVGVICLLAGGIVGGIAVATGSLKRWIWPMALSLTLPCIIYCIFAHFIPENFILICIGMGFEQFGYGFGFTGYMLFLMYFSKGKSQTSHYAFCTAFMALGMMIPGMFAGWMFESVKNMGFVVNAGMSGFESFFWLVMISCLATFLAVFLVQRKLHGDSFGDIESSKEEDVENYSDVIPTNKENYQFGAIEE